MEEILNKYILKVEEGSLSLYQWNEVVELLEDLQYDLAKYEEKTYPKNNTNL